MNEKLSNADQSRKLNPSGMHCADKRVYTSMGEAQRAATGRQREGVGYLRVYHCPDCGGFHLTSQKPNSAA